MTKLNQFRQTVDKRYNGNIWYPDTNLFYLSERILDWYYNDELGIVIIHGQQGYGKSTYAAISCAEVYGHNKDTHQFKYDWDAVKKHIVFTPRQFLELSKQTTTKDRMIVWDDAGYWLNTLDYYHPLVKAVGKFIEVARSKWGAIVFTCADLRQIMGKVRNIPHAYSVPIRKGATPSKNSSDYTSMKTRRYAKVHKSWCSEDLKKSGKKGKEIDIFHARMPKTFYEWYRPFRDTFCDQGLTDIESELERMGI